MGELDIVCPNRQGNKNNELRYALRSWEAHVPHRNIWLMGSPPAWTQQVEKTPFRQGPNFRLNTTLAMEKACNNPAISDPFIWMNDDYFIMKPIPEVPHLNRGYLNQVIMDHPDKKHIYLQGMQSTKGLLIDMGFAEFDILSYELHMPMLIHKTTMLYTIKVYRESRRDNLHKRTLYGNIIQYEGETVEDNKIVNPVAEWDKECTYISTSDMSFERHLVGAWVRSHFPETSRYEYVESL